MRIAMIAPLVEPVPPLQYGGTERVVSVLTEELVQRGHAVTLFASGDSQTRAELVPGCPRGLRLDPDVGDYLPHTLLQLGAVYRRAGDFDLIHNHTDYVALPFARLVTTPTLTTIHGRLDLADAQLVYGAYPEQPLISISDAQRAPLPSARWLATVYHGIDLSQLTFRPEPGDYLLYLARISPDKRPDRAIDIARDVGMRLVMAAKIARADQDYFQHAVEPLIRACPLVEYLGEVDIRTRDALFGGAYAYLFPIDWPEPFGLTLVESMATGTPVIAYRAGSVPEVVADGVTGFVCTTMSEMIAAVPRIRGLDRRACRADVERRFSPTAMADAYERAYAALLDAEAPGRALPGRAASTGPRAGGDGAFGDGRLVPGPALGSRGVYPAQRRR